jgi:xanthine dehydrogenase accessory factor
MTDQQVPSSLTTAAIQSVIEQGSIAALATLLTGEVNVGSKLLVVDHGTVLGSFGNPDLDRAVINHAKSFLDSREEARMFSVGEFAPDLREWAEVRILFERLQPEPHLVICGAGHVGAALARLASFLGYRATLIDDRAEFVVRDRFPDGRVDLLATSDWTEAVRESVGKGHGVAVAIVTRGHNEDEQCIGALINSNAEYVGLIGSKRRTNIVLDHLREAGASKDFLSRVHAPIGLDIAAVTPEEVALAIIAEIVSERRGGKGGSLSAWRREGKKI